MDSVRGGQSGASVLRCAAVHLNPTNQRRRGPGCVVGQDALNKGRRPGGGPLNKGVIQLSTNGDCVGVATYSATRSCDSSDHEEPAGLAEGKNGSTPRRDRGAVRVRVM